MSHLLRQLDRQSQRLSAGPKGWSYGVASIVLDLGNEGSDGVLIEYNGVHLLLSGPTFEYEDKFVSARIEYIPSKSLLQMVAEMADGTTKIVAKVGGCQCCGYLQRRVVQP